MGVFVCICVYTANIIYLSVHTTPIYCKEDVMYVDEAPINLFPLPFSRPCRLFVSLMRIYQIRYDKEKNTVFAHGTYNVQSLFS